MICFHRRPAKKKEGGQRIDQITVAVKETLKQTPNHPSNRRLPKLSTFFSDGFKKLSPHNPLFDLQLK